MTSRQPGGIAGRAGRWSARHRKTAIIGWLTFVVLALVAGGLAAYASVGDLGRRSVQLREDYSGRVDRAVEELKALIEDNTR